MSDKYKLDGEATAQVVHRLMEVCHEMAKDKGWWDDERTFGDCIALIHSELSEALEDFRDGKRPSTIYYNKDKPYGIAVELADVLIRLFDMCKKFDIPLHIALLEKIKYNATRPYRHGNKAL